MSESFFMVLRRLRRPLIIVIIVLSVSVGGLANIPGVNADGHSATLGYFHAFYVISYTATTIGFGEVPYPFSEAQRAWVILSIYMSVTTWAYALGSVFHMTRDPLFRAALTRNQFSGRVRRITDPFVLIIGYGQSGVLLTRMFDRMGLRTVVVELRAVRAARIEVEEYQQTPLFLIADGRQPDVLVDAGVTHRQCQAMVVLSGDDDTIQAVAIGGTVLNPSLRIVARAHSSLATSNLECFNKIEIVNPFETFAANIGLDLGSPEKLQVEEWLTGLPGETRPEVLALPMGHWIICGFGRFGRYVANHLEKAGASWTAIDNNPDLPDEPSLLKRGYSQDSLREAGIDHAVGMVACTDRDAINLASVNRARMVNEDLFIAIRQTHASNASLIEASNANLRFIQADVMSHEVRQIITTPLLNRFLVLLRADKGDLAQRTTQALELHVQDRVPFLWGFNCLGAYPGLREALALSTEEDEATEPFSIKDLLMSPDLHPPQPLNAVALLLVRGKKEEILLPSPDTPLQTGDRILFAGEKGIQAIQQRYLFSPTPLEYVRTGIESPRAWIFRYLPQRKQTKLWRERKQRRENMEKEDE